MAQLTVANYLGLLQEDPDDEAAFNNLREVLDNGDKEQLGEDPVRLLEMARVAHERRGEVRAAAWLIELEMPLIEGDPLLSAALFKELARIRHEDLLDDDGARGAYRKALELAPGDEEVERAIERVDQAAENWEQIANKFVEEANKADDVALRSSLLTRAASLIWQYGRERRTDEVDGLFTRVLEGDPSATKAARLYGETLRAREKWQECAEVLLGAAQNARAKDEKLNLYVHAGRVFARRLSESAKAADCYGQVLDFSPGHEEALKFLVEFFTEQEQWDHLVAVYEDALKSRQKPEAERGTLLQIAMVHWRIRNAADKAEPYFARLRKIDPTHPGMLEFYREYLPEEDPEKLIQVLGDAQRVATSEDERKRLAIELARVAGTGDETRERAIDAWKAVQRLDPNSKEAREALKELYRKSEKWNALVDVLKSEAEAATEPTDKVAVWRSMIPIYRDQLSLDVMVINTYNLILEVEPSDGEALSALATTFEGVGRYNDLIQVLTKQAELLTDNQEKTKLLMRVANLWIDRFANYNQATGPLETVASIDPENREALGRLKEIYQKKRAWAALFDVLSREAKLASDPTARLNHHLELAKLATDRLHENGKAIELWKGIVDEAPTTDGALDALEKLAEREKDWDTLAYALEKRAETLTPTDDEAEASDNAAQVAVLQKLGSVYSDHLNRPAEAAKTWQRILDIDPSNGRATRTLRESFLSARDWDGLLGLYAASDDWEGLVEVLGAAAERADDDELKIELSFRAVDIYEDKIGEPYRAFRNLERVLATDPKNQRALRSLVPIYERDEKWSRLLQLKSALLDSLPEDAPVEDQLAALEELRVVALNRLSDEQDAFRWASRAYQLAPNNPDVVRGLEEAADEAKAYELLRDLYRARLDAGLDAGCDEREQLTLRRRVAEISGEVLGNTGEAIEQLEQILESNPGDSEAVISLDRLYRAEQRTEDLRKLYLLRLNHAEQREQKVELLTELAHLEEDVFDDAAATATRYEAILEVDPAHEPSLENLDRIYTHLDRTDDLRRILETRRDSATSDEDRNKLTMRVGELAIPEGDLPGALAAFESVLSSVAGHEGAVRGLEQLDALFREREEMDQVSEVGRLLESAYEARNSEEKLLGVLEKRLKRAKKSERRELRLRVAELHGQLGNAEGAFEMLANALKDEPADSELWDRLAVASDAADSHAALAASYQGAIDSGKLDGDALQTLAKRTATLYEDLLEQPAKAEPLYGLILAEEPTNAYAFGELKRLYTDTERWEELQVLYEAQLEHTVNGDEKAELLKQVCFLYEELLDDPGLAISAHQQVLELEPSYKPSRRALDQLYRRTERWGDLAGLLDEELSTAEGQDALDITFELGELFEKKLAKPTRAVDQYEATLRENPNHIRSQEALERLLSDESAAANSGNRQRIAAILEPLYSEQGAYAELARILEVQLADLSDPGSKVGLHLRISELRERKLHDLDGAFASLGEAVKLDPRDASAREELARVSELRARPSERAAVLEGVLSTEQAADGGGDPHLASELLLEIATLWDTSANDYDQAEAAYRRLIDHDPGEARTVLPAAQALERIHMGRGQHAELAGALRQQIRFQDDVTNQERLLVRLAMLLEDRLNDRPGAVAAHRQRLDLNPTDEDALLSLTRLYTEQGEWAQLIGILRTREQASVDASVQQDLARQIGEIYQEKLSDADSAIAAYNDVLSRFGPEPRALTALSGLYESTERWDDLLEITRTEYEALEDPVARAELQFRAAELMRTRTGQPEQAVEAYGDVLESAGEHEASLNALESMMNDGEQDDRIRLDAARLLRERFEGTQQYDRLLLVLDVVATSNDPRERTGALRRASEVAEVGLDDSKRAFALMGKSVRASLGEPDLGDLLNDYERLAGSCDEWETYADTLVEIEPNIFDGEVQTRVQLSVARVSQDRLENAERARAFYSKVLGERPEHSEALDALESLYSSAGDHEGLLRILTRKTELAEQSGDQVELLLRQAALAQDHLERPDLATDAFERALDLSPRPEAFEGLEGLYATGERFHDLASLLERRLDQGVGAPIGIRYRLGRVHQDQLSDPAMALSHYREALALDPEHQVTIDALASLMEMEEYRSDVAEILEPVYMRNMDWPRVAQVLEARLASEHGPGERRALLERLGDLYETYLQDLSLSLEAYGRLFVEEPGDVGIWDTMTRLARNEEKFDRLAELFGGVLNDRGIDDPALVELALRTGQIHEERLTDTETHLSDAAHFYRMALDFEPDQTAPFQALERVFVRTEKHEELLSLYRSRVDAVSGAEERVALLHKRADIQENQISDVPSAIATYTEILEVAPEEPVATPKLEALLTQESRFADLAEELRRRIDLAAGNEHEVHLRHQLGELVWKKLGEPERAIDAFEEIVVGWPGHKPTVQALEVLVTEEAHQLRILEILQPIYEASDEWRKLIAIKEAKVGLLDDPFEQVALLTEVAQLHEDRGDDTARALDAWSRSFVLDPSAEEPRANLDRLTEARGEWDLYAETLESAIKGADDPSTVSDLMRRLAEVHDQRRNKPKDAIAAYERLLEHNPDYGPDEVDPLDALDALHTMVADWEGLVSVLSRKAERSFDEVDRSSIHRRTGSVLEDMIGDRERAVDAYTRAADADPESLEALVALDRLHAQAGNSEELASVLARRIDAEPNPADRAELGLRLGAVAENQLKRPGDAIASFQRVLDDHPDHVEAVLALARLYEHQSLWPELIQNLRLRASVAESPDERVALTFRAGEVLERELVDIPEAIATYEEALSLDPTHEASVASLIRISHTDEYREQATEILVPHLTSQQRHDDLADVVARQADTASNPDDRKRYFQQLAGIRESGQADPGGAFDAITRALAEDSEDTGLVDELARLAGATGRFGDFANQLSDLAGGTTDPIVSRGLYVRLAQVAEHNLNDEARAIEAFVRASEQMPEDPELLAHLDRLYMSTQAYAPLGDILERRVALAMEPEDASELALRLGGLREQQFGDLRGAFQAYSNVLDHDPSNALAVASLERLLGEESLALQVVDVLERAYRAENQLDRVAGLYDVRIRFADDVVEKVRLLSEVAEIWERDLGRPADALRSVRQSFELSPTEPTTLDDIERLCTSTGDWEQVRGLVESAKEKGSATDPIELRDLHFRAAGWYRDRLGDLATAEARLKDAIELDPEFLEGHEALSELLHSPGREAELVSALVRWADIDNSDIARAQRLREAARLAEGATGNLDVAADCYERVVEIDPSDAVSLDELARLRAEQGRFDDVVRILGQRVDAEMDPAARLHLRHQIAQLCRGPLENPERAMEAYRAALDEEPSDMVSITALEELFEGAEQWEDLSDIYERRLDLANTTDEQIAARVRLARLSEQRFGRRAQAIEQLQEILGIDPQHGEALDELARLLGADERWDDLIELLERRLGDAEPGDIEQRVALLRRMAEVQSGRAGLEAEAAAFLGRIVDIMPEDVEALSAIVDLNERAGDFAGAADALSQLGEALAASQNPESAVAYRRVAVISAEHLHDGARAERALRRAFELQPSDAETRDLLKAHFRAESQFADLAEVLSFEEGQAESPEEKVALLKSLADLYHTQLGDAERAAGCLERAAALVPEDRAVLLPLCDLYIEAGRSEAAVPVLEKIIDSYGTRRVKEAARYHHRLARALESMGDKPGALARYESAFKIDLTNIEILRDLGRLSFEMGDLDRAQKTFRALLLQKLTPESGIAKADVYYFLGDISAQQGDNAKAKSMLKRAVAERPDHEQAAALLARLS